MSEWGQTLGFVSPMVGLLPATQQASFVLLSQAAGPNPADHTELLHAEDRLLMSTMRSEKRRREFALGRIAARRALSKLQIGPLLPELALLGRRPSGAVDWPDGVCGSISHCGPYAAAVVAPSAAVFSIGIDLQGITKFEGTEIALRIADSDERAWVAESTAPLDAIAVLFSAKESLYKALSAFTGPGLGFHDVRCRPLQLVEDTQTGIKSGVFGIQLVKESLAKLLSEKIAPFNARVSSEQALRELAAPELSVSVQLAQGYVLTGVVLFAPRLS